MFPPGGFSRGPGGQGGRGGPGHAGAAPELLRVGPCPDGGYYLIASKTPPNVFTGIPWSTSNVLSLTIDRLMAEGRTYAFLPLERDVDHPADLEILSHER